MNTSRAHVLMEANYRQVQELNPNVAVLPWGATEAHNYHMPYGTDITEAATLGEAAAARANSQGARCVVLPPVPFGVNHSQLYQKCTITMRASTQALVLRDVAESLMLQGIDRLVLLNYHGGNDFRAMIRDIMFDFPIFIIQVHGHQLAPGSRTVLENKGDHADEYETCLLLHLCPELVAMENASDGAVTPSALSSLTQAGVWATRDWQTLTKDTGVGDPRAATAEKGKVLFHATVEALAPVLLELSNAQNGEFPFIVRDNK